MAEEKKGGKSKRTRAVIDRIEDGGTAVLLAGEDELKVELPAALLPEGAEGGSHLVLNISLDETSRKEAEERVKALQERVEKRGGEGRKNFKL
jgi:hypothetical protein